MQGGAEKKFSMMVITINRVTFDPFASIKFYLIDRGIKRKAPKGAFDLILPGPKPNYVN
jgi:hypothetical protein